MKRILVTTVVRGAPVEKSGNAYIYDFDSRSIIAQTGMLPLNARFARNPRGGIRGLRGACMHNNTIYIASNDIITALDYEFNMLYTIEDRLFCNLHELKWQKQDNSMIIVSCGNDRVLGYRKGNDIGSLMEMYPDTGFSYNKIDTHGLYSPNSATLYKGDLYVAFARRGAIYSYRNGEKEKHIVGNGVLHNIIADDHGIYFNDSPNSRLIYMDLETGNKRIIMEDPISDGFENTEQSRWGWFRGMDKIGQKMLIGSSPNARVCLLDLDAQNSKDWISLSTSEDEAVYTAIFFEEDWYTRTDNIDVQQDHVDNIDKKYSDWYRQLAVKNLSAVKSNTAHKMFRYEKNLGVWHVSTIVDTYPRLLKMAEKHIHKELEIGLDLGCGTVTFFDFLKVKRPILIDIVPEYVKFMKERGHDARTGDIENLDFPDDYADIIVCSDILEHVLSMDRALSEVRRVLKSDGYLLVNIPWEQNLPGKNKLSGFSHVRRFDGNNLSSRFEGWAIIDTEITGGMRGWIKGLNIILHP